MPEMSCKQISMMLRPSFNSKSPTKLLCIEGGCWQPTFGQTRGRWDIDPNAVPWKKNLNCINTTSGMFNGSFAMKQCTGLSDLMQNTEIQTHMYTYCSVVRVHHLWMHPHTHLNCKYRHMQCSLLNWKPRKPSSYSSNCEHGRLTHQVKM